MKRTREQMNRIPEEELDDIEAEFRCWHMYVGQLDPEEMKTFELLTEHGRARWSYDGPLAIFGIAKVVRA